MKMSLPTLFDIRGKVAVVTGGATGIGIQMASALAEAGCNLVICSRKISRCQEATEELMKYGIEVLALECNVADEEQVHKTVKNTLGKFGAIDILVNNSGTTWGANPEDTPRDGWDKVLAVNLTGTFLFSKHVGKHMIQKKQGKIINISSVTAYKGMDHGVMNAIAYNTSKGGVISFTRDLAIKWAPYGINVNAIAPGWFPSDLSNRVLDEHGQKILAEIPMQRFGNQNDLKGLVVYLASPASGYVTGQTIVVDGGLSVG
jgi:NAD(P)-dependent dehydrogenase (short-subunit alcohol dehydrogenase family)